VAGKGVEKHLLEDCSGQASMWVRERSQRMHARRSETEHYGGN
jgi:hypothetical protein